MSLHKQPLTVAEAEGLKNHGLPIGTPSQLSDSFRLGMAWAERVSCRLLGLLNRKFTSGNDVPVTQVRLSRSEIDEELQKMPDETPAKPLAPLSPGDVVITPRNIRKVYLGADGEAIFSERMRAHCVGHFSVPFRSKCPHEDAEFPEECPWCAEDGMVEDSVKVPVEVCQAIYQAMVAIAPQEPLCEDEGCPQHGSDHVCMNKPLGYIRWDSLVAGADILPPDRPVTMVRDEHHPYTIPVYLGAVSRWETPLPLITESDLQEIESFITTRLNDTCFIPRDANVLAGFLASAVAELRCHRRNQKPCDTCKQVDKGQTGEYPCKECGLPTMHDLLQ